MRYDIYVWVIVIGKIVLDHTGRRRRPTQLRPDRENAQVPDLLCRFE